MSLTRWIGMASLVSLASSLGACGSALASPASPSASGWQVAHVTYCAECDGYNKVTLALEPVGGDPAIARLELVTLRCEPGAQPLGFQAGAFAVTVTPREPAATVPAFDDGELVLDACGVGQVAGRFRLDRGGQPSIAGAFDQAPDVVTSE